jgi:hypothetical protein
MKAYQHELAHFYEHREKVLNFSSASLFQSLITASAIGVLVAFIGVALDTVRRQGNSSWYVSATTAGVLEATIVAILVTMVDRRATQASDPTDSGTRLSEPPHPQRHHSDEYGGARR